MPRCCSASTAAAVVPADSKGKAHDDDRDNSSSRMEILEWVKIGGTNSLPPLTATTLDLSRCGWGDSDARIFASLLHRLPDLTNLSLGFNSISDSGVEAITQSCRRGALRKLERLYLAGNDVGEQGVDALVRSLRSNQLPSCSHINLAKNPRAEETKWLVEELLLDRDYRAPDKRD